MTETEQRRSMSLSDLRVLSDLSIYNCLNFGPYEFIIYEDQQEVRKYGNIQVAQEAAQLAGGLEALGIRKGDRIIVMMINSPEVLISYQGIARAGGIIIPVLPLLKGPELRYIAENSGARAIITSSVLLPLLRHALVDLPDLQHIISTGTIEDEGQGQDKPTSYRVHAYKDVLAGGSRVPIDRARGDDEY